MNFRTWISERIDLISNCGLSPYLTRLICRYLQNLQAKWNHEDHFNAVKVMTKITNKAHILLPDSLLRREKPNSRFQVISPKRVLTEFRLQVLIYLLCMKSVVSWISRCSFKCGLNSVDFLKRRHQVGK